MNCANHSQTPSTAYCRTCGKALCEDCKRDVRGVIYCEECIVARMQGTLPAVASASVSAAVPASGGPNPTAAAFLGLIPGVGAMYNGQFLKAFVHVVIFAVLISATDSGGGAEAFFGLMIPVFIVYQIVDAYRTAKAKQLGQPLPEDLLGLGQGLWAGSRTGNGDAGMPLGALFLIGLGVLFLLANMEIIHISRIGRLWPLILIFFGIRMFMQRSGPRTP